MDPTADARPTEPAAVEAAPIVPLGWEDRTSLIHGFRKAAYALATQARSPWKAVGLDGGWADPTLFAVLAWMLEALAPAVWVAAFAWRKAPRADESPFWSACAAVLVVVVGWTLVSLAIGAVDVLVERWLLARRGAPATFAGGWRLYCYSHAPTIFAPLFFVFPYFLPLAMGIWSREVRAQAYRTHLGLSSGRAAAVTWLPVVMVVVLAALGLGAAIAIDELT